MNLTVVYRYLWYLFFNISFHTITSSIERIKTQLRLVDASPFFKTVLWIFWLCYQLIFHMPSDISSQAPNKRFYHFCHRVQCYYPSVDFTITSLANLIRFTIQSIFLICYLSIFVPSNQRTKIIGTKNLFRLIHFGFKRGIVDTSRQLLFKFTRLTAFKLKKIEHSNILEHKSLRYGLIVLTIVLACLSIVVPFDAVTQLIFSIILWCIALWFRSIPGNVASLLMMMLSIIVSSRYIWWRVNNTLNWDDYLGLVLGIGLLLAELYSWLILILGFLQTAWPLKRKVVVLPNDTKHWPSVDIYIPTYNEPLKVLKPTVLAAQQIDWPHEKLNVYVLDDGKRDEIKQFCHHVGVNYITRPDNSFAKAGNLNHAMKITKGDFIAIFDCDHIPVRSFLQVTIGGFLKDDKLALVQTPHHFFSPDPFERNLSVFRDSPNEGELFYGQIQDGNDLWNATFFCGSCAVLRRTMLEEVGGIATETVTEDAHTALKLHALGYRSAYVNLRQAAGLATESISAHIGQRIRWARGMAQIFRLHNPLFAKGLSFMQRLCYSNGMLHFFYGLPRMIFLTAPLAFLLLHSYIIYAPAINIFLYAIPAIFHANLTNTRHQGKYRNTFWAEMYETVLAWYIFFPTLMAIITPKKGKFNVTEKGGLVDEAYFDWRISIPYLILILLNITGICWGIKRIAAGPEQEIMTVLMNIVWTLYNLLILGGALAVATESKQVRRSHRIDFNLPVTITTENGHIYDAELTDYSETGFGIKINESLHQLAIDQELKVVIERGDITNVFNVKVICLNDNHLGVYFTELTLAESKSLIESTFSRADAWLDVLRSRKREYILPRLKEVALIGLRGYRNFAIYFKNSLKKHCPTLSAILAYFVTFLPKRPIYEN